MRIFQKIRSRFENKKIRVLLYVFILFSLVAGIVKAQNWATLDFNIDGKVNSIDLAEIIRFFGCPGNCPIVSSPTPTPISSSGWTSCDRNPLGASLQGIPQLCGDCHSGPTIVKLSQKGYGGMVGSLNCEDQVEYFPQISDANWRKQSICNSLDCLRGRVPGGSSMCASVHYDFLSYGPERSAGVPIEEQRNLPWATTEAEKIAESAGLPLFISYGTVQLHQEAYERPECGNNWNNIECIVNLLAPHGDRWTIQAADEFNNPNLTGNPGPVVSQMHYLPGSEWRAAVKRWYDAIKAANPNIRVWIQLALHRVGDAQNYPTNAELLLEYREWLVSPKYGPPVVDGVYISSVYSYPTQDGWQKAEAELERAYDLACGQQGGPTNTPTPKITSTPAPTATPPAGNIKVVEEGWTDNVVISGLTLEGGYYYRIFENSSYKCGDGGPYQFIVYDSSPNISTNKNLFVKFPGGGIGFYYYNNSGQKVYFIHPQAAGILTSSYARNTFFRTGISAEFANGLTKVIRNQNIKGSQNARLAVMSYCSHDFYFGRGQYDATDGFSRYGYFASTQAIDFIQSYYATNRTVTFGGSSGAANYFVAKNQNDVAGIVMDSQAGDLSALSQACENGISIHGSGEACFCPDGGVQCHAEFARRIGFTLGQDEPYKNIQRGEVNKPIYLIWNKNDASRYAYLEYENLHNAIQTYNPAGKSVARMVCITNPDSPPGPTCNLHVPTGQDYDYLVNPADDMTSKQLVSDVYNWMIQRLNGN